MAGVRCVVVMPSCSVHRVMGAGVLVQWQLRLETRTGHRTQHCGRENSPNGEHYREHEQQADSKDVHWEQS
jgi:hypothetical protein